MDTSGCFAAGAPSYRAVFPELPRAAGSCAQSGVLGTAVGRDRDAAGAPRAGVALAVRAEPACGRLLSVDFQSLHLGGFSFSGATEPDTPPLRFISPGAGGGG